MNNTTKTKLQNSIKLFEVNVKEIKKILDIIEKNNTVIDNDSIIFYELNIPFVEKNKNQIEFKSDILEKIEKKNLHEFDIICSLIGLRNIKTDKLYPIISKSTNGNIYVNFLFLKELNFNEYYLKQLVSLKGDKYNLNNILNLLFKGLVPYLPDLVFTKYKDFEKYNIENRIKILRELFEIAQDSHTYQTFDRFYFYYIEKYNLLKELKNDIDNIERTIEGNITANYLFNRMDLNFKLINLPFQFDFVFPKDLYSLNKQKLSFYQSFILRNFNKNIFTVLGLAGSGKTYTSTIISKIFLIFDAVNFTFERKSLPILYSSYSKESVKNFGRIYAMHTDDFLPLNFSFENKFMFKQIEEKFNEIEDTFVKQAKIERLRKIDQKLKNKYKGLYENLKKYLKIHAEYYKKFNEILTEEEISVINFLIKELQEKKKDYTFLNKFLNFLKKILSKNFQESEFFININTLYKIKRVIKVKGKKIVVNENNIDKLLNYFIRIKEKAEKSLPEMENFIKEYEFDLFNDNKFVLNIDDIDWEEVIFYEKYKYLLLEKKEIKNIKNTLSYFLSFQYDKNGNKEFVKDLKNKDIFENFFTLFPIITTVIDNIPFFDIEKKFFLTILDEIFLIPSYMLYNIFFRSYASIGFGDINQLNLIYLFNIDSFYEEIKNLYSKEFYDNFLKYNLFFDEKLDVQNMYKIFQKLNSNVEILIDNFRSIKELVYTQLRNNETYVSYMYKFFEKNKEYLSKKLYNKVANAKTLEQLLPVINIFNQEKVLIKKLNGEYTENPLLLLHSENREESIKKFLEFLSVQEMLFESILITTLFKQDVEIIKRLTKNYKEEFNIKNEIDVISADKIQSLEYDVVYFISNIVNDESQGYLYLMSNPKILNVIISRAKKVFILNCNIDFCLKDNNSINSIITKNNFELL